MRIFNVSRGFYLTRVYAGRCFPLLTHLVQQHRGFSFRCHFCAGGGTAASTSATATGCRCGTCRCFWCFSRIFRNFGKFFFSLLGVMKLTKNQRIELTQTLPKLDDFIKVAMQLQAPSKTHTARERQRDRVRERETVHLECLEECTIIHSV